MTTNNPFSPTEIASATEGPAVDAELDEVEAADIDEKAPEGASHEDVIQKGKRLAPEQVRAVVESLLFVAEAPLALDQLKQATGIRREALEGALAELSERYKEGSGGIVLHEAAGGWQLRTDPACSDFVRRYLQVKPQRLTRAALETLSIIAYRQPVTRPEVEDVRGVDSGAVIKALLERRLLKILGKKEEVGRPILYGTTREFLEFFSLRDLGSLPTLKEFQELSKEHQEIVEKETGPSEPVPSLASLADPAFKSSLESTRGEADDALHALEDAISTADERAKRTAASLSPPEAAPSAPAPAPSAPEGDAP